MSRAVTSVERRRRFSLFQLGLGILIFVGVGIRFWKMSHGLPHFFYSDEGIFTYQALNMGGQGLNSHYFVHPTLFLYLLLFLDATFILSGMLTGIFHQPSDAWKLYLADPTIFYLLGRYASAVFGVLTIPLTYFIGKKLFDRKVGLLGAVFLTFSLLHVQWSQLGYSDVPLTLLTSLAFFFAFLAVREGGLRYFVVSGFVSGLAASTKYQGLTTLLWGPLAGVLVALKKRKNPVRELWGKRHLSFLSFLILGFTVGTPFWFLEFRQFTGHLLWNWNNLKTLGAGHLGYEGNWNWGYYLTTALPYGLGLPVEICGILGVILLASRLQRERLFFISFPTIYFFVIGLSRIRWAKYLLPVFPFLCLAAGYFLVTALSRIMRKETKGTLLVLCLTGFLVVLPSLANTFRYAYIRQFPDTRELAYAWLRENISSKNKVLQGSYAQLPQLPSGPFIKRLDAGLLNQRAGNRSSFKSLKRYREEGFEYLVLDEWHLGIGLKEAAREPRRRKTAERYQNFVRELEKSATLLVSFSPYREDNIPFDMENVELPSRSLWKMKRTGPTIWIYKL